MSLVLSNAFKGVLLSSYVNMRFDLAVKSLDDLIYKIETKHYDFEMIKALDRDTLKSELISKLKNRLSKDRTFRGIIFSMTQINDTNK